jgi:predicted transcriptional regulator of viral defense system
MILQTRTFSNLTVMENVEKFIEKQRAIGSYSFTFKEVQKAFDCSEKALKQSLYRLKTKGKIIPIRKEFYIIIPAEYSHVGIIPVTLFLDDLMKSLKKEYYIGLFSAAALQGASHQAIMEYYVITDYPPIRSIKHDKIVINFFTKKNWLPELIIQRKTDAGYLNVSCPELTIIDLLNYGNITINRIATILDELVESFDQKRLKMTIGQASTATIQRLGYLLEIIGHNTHYTKILLQQLKKRKVFAIPLSVHLPKKGNLNANWNVIENISIETDL